MDYLKENGSLDCERIDTLSIGRYMDVIGELTPEQLQEYHEYEKDLPSTMNNGPVKPVRVNESFRRNIIDIHTSCREFRHEEKAEAIADMYLSKNPRPEFFLVDLYSSSEDSRDGYYNKLSKAEKDIILNWERNLKNEISLDEFLYKENRDLHERLVTTASLYTLDTIENCDMDNVVKFSTCQIRDYDQDSGKNNVYDATFPLDDRDFKELLADRIASYRSLTMNSVIVYHPEIAQKIMRYLLCLTGMEYENHRHFMVIFTEIDNAFKDIVEHIDNLDIEFRCYLKLRNIIG